MLVYIQPEQRAVVGWGWDFDTESTDICLRQDEPEIFIGGGEGKGEEEGGKLPSYGVWQERNMQV